MELTIETSHGQDYFDAKAHRYLSAMAECENARVSELAPIISLIPPKSNRLIDLLGGHGFVSDFLSNRFDHILLADKSNAMLPQQTAWRRVQKIHATKIKLGEIGEQTFDLAVCLAGFHHILPEGFDDERYDLVNAVRQETMDNWFTLVSPGGRLVVADVPSKNTIITSFSFKTDETAFLRNCESNLSSHFNDDRHHLAICPEPALFFDRFVKSYCPNGHEGVFESKESLSKKFRNAGFHNVQSSVRYVPWLFSSVELATWFIGELFAIGPESLKSPLQLGKGQSLLINEAVDRYLGRSCFDDGTCLVHWKLLYVWGDKPGE